MVTVFWDAQEILLVDFLEIKNTITSAYYEGVFRKLPPKISWKNALESCINASSSTMTIHLLMVLIKQEVWYMIFNGKSSDIPLISLCFQN